MATFVVAALVVSLLSLGVVVDKTQGGSGAGATAAPAAESPGFDFAAQPSDGFKARDARASEPTTHASPEVHKVTFDIVEKRIEIAPGVSQLMWTYNGEVPGPTLRGKVGDRFEVTLVNHGSMSHSIDFHASEVAPNVTMRMIAPKQTLVYEFEATHAGIYLYHCGTPPILQHMAMGMYGAVIVDPPHLPAVDDEFVLVQSELYRETDPSQPVGYDEIVADRSDGVAFNGYVNQYAEQPIRVQPDRKIRVWVVNAGPSGIASFHVIGAIFDTVYKEGEYVLRPGRDRGGSQALDLMPAQGGFVEFTLAVPGKYPFISHRIADASRGAAGEFAARAAATNAGG